jgi:prevent-host-death family protein
MATPDILSVREFRTGLTGVIKQVQEPGADPVFVGAHRKPEAVIMSVSQYEQLQRAAALRREAVTEALASGAEGLEPSPEGLDMFEASPRGG